MTAPHEQENGRTAATSETPAPRPELSLVFPVFDEVANLGELIETAQQIASRLTHDFEIILVDDGSRDGSGSGGTLGRGGRSRGRHCHVD